MLGPVHDAPKGILAGPIPQYAKSWDELERRLSLTLTKAATRPRTAPQTALTEAFPS